MGAQIPMLAEKPLVSCGCKKFKVDALGDHLRTCTAHSGVKKTHDWVVGQLADLFRTTQTAKTQQVVRSREQYCGDVELVGSLANVPGPVPLVLDLRIAHDHFGSSSDPILNGQLHYPFWDDPTVVWRTNPPYGSCQQQLHSVTYLYPVTLVYFQLDSERTKVLDKQCHVISIYVDEHPTFTNNGLFVYYASMKRKLI
jgi:hypothetical protein